MEAMCESLNLPRRERLSTYRSEVQIAVRPNCTTAISRLRRLLATARESSSMGAPSYANIDPNFSKAVLARP
jgi:hypothetical protein